MDNKKDPPRIFEARDYPEKDLTERIIGSAIEVHKQLGPGLRKLTTEARRTRRKKDLVEIRIKSH